DARVQRHKQQREGERALASLGGGGKQRRHLSCDRFIARQRAVGIGAVDDDRAEVVLVSLPALACNPVEQPALQALGRAYHAAIRRERQIKRNEATAAPFGFHQLARQIGDLVAFRVAAKQKL